MHVAFDVGNVLVDVEFDAFFNELVKAGIKDDPYQFCLDIQARQDIGVKTIMIRVRDRLGTGVLEESENKIIDAWNGAIIPNNQMLDFLDDLKENDVNVAILSNMGLEHAQYIREEHPRIFNGCDLHLSSEVGARKPTKLYFQSFLLQHPEYNRCPFLDDRIENVAAANEVLVNISNKMRLKGIHFELSEFKKWDLYTRKEYLEKLRVKIYYST